ncbi:MAG: ATP-binding protein [Myxococcales bacterium]|nr:ATP-binding protein [Myxococcales bacterium]
MHSARSCSDPVLLVGFDPARERSLRLLLEEAGHAVRCVAEGALPAPDLATERVGCVVAEMTCAGTETLPIHMWTHQYPPVPTIAVVPERETSVARRRDLGVTLLYPASAPIEGLATAIDGSIAQRRDRPAHGQQLRFGPSEGMQALMDSLTAIVILAGDGGLITHLNPAARRTFGLESPNGTKAPTLANSGIAWTDSEVGSQLEQARAAGEPCRLDDIEFRDGQGRMRLLGLTLNPLEGGLALLMGRDITERKREEELGLQRRKLESIGQLAAGVAHEINTPIQFIADNIGFLDRACRQVLALVAAQDALLGAVPSAHLEPTLLRAAERALRRSRLDFLKQEWPKAVADSMAGIDSITSIVEALKGFSHSDAQETVEADLNQAWRSVVTITQAAWRPVAELTLELQADLPLVACREGEIKQVFLHLLTNAVHAVEDRSLGAGNKGQIVIRTSHRDGTVESSISDTGMGIPDAIRARIFDPFFTTKAMGRGSGQGLPLVRAIVEQRHAGQVEFDTAYGKGTTFRVGLPSAARGAGVRQPKAS